MAEDSEQQINKINQQVVRLHQQGLYEQAIQLGTKACNLARYHLGVHHDMFAISLNNLAMSYVSTGEYAQAESFIQQAIAIWKATSGEAHPNVASGLNNLAELYREQGDYVKAELLYQQSLAIRQTALGPSHVDTATSIHNLAEVYRMMGKYQEAEPLYQQALMTWQAALGEQHPLVATVLGNMALLYKLQGAYLQAEPLYQQALLMYQTMLGQEHPHVATILNNLAELYRVMGDYIQSEVLHHQALHIRRKVLGEKHPYVAISLNNLAMLCYEKGDYAQAERFYQQALSIRQEILGKGHPLVADTLNNLTLLYHAMGNFVQAERFCQASYDIFQASLGENHPYTATSLSNLAALSMSMSNYAQAEPILHKTLVLWQQALGKMHPEVATSMNNLATLYQELGDYTEAERYNQEALSIRQKSLGSTHPDVALSLHNLAALYSLMGQYTQAEPLYQQALALQQKALGEIHPDRAISLSNLACLYAATGRESVAFNTLKQAISIDDQMIGQVISISSEKQRLLYLKTQQKFVNTFLSLLLRYFSHSVEVIQTGLDLIIRRKAISAEVLSVQRDLVLGGRYPSLREQLRELTILRSQIVQRTLVGPGAESLTDHQRLLSDWIANKERLEAILAQQIPEMNLTQQLQSATRQTISNALPLGSVLVEFVRFHVFDFQAIPAHDEPRWKPAHYAAFLIATGKADSVQFIDLGPAEPIDHMISALREAITSDKDKPFIQQTTHSALSARQQKKKPRRQIKVPVKPLPSSEAYENVGRRLREAIFDPLIKEFDGCTQLFLAPDGDLNRLPFEILPTQNGRHVIDEYRISYLNTGRDALRLDASSTGVATEALVIADPNFDLATTDKQEINMVPVSGRRSRDWSPTTTFSRLPGTRKEGKRVAAMLNVTPHMDNQALESRLKACHSPHILHIATHGFFLLDQSDESDEETALDAFPRDKGRLAQLLGQRLENPLLRSGLALAGANTWDKGGSLPLEAEDGLLTAEDVSGLDLSATELVVLSACETGLGEIQAGEGVFGLRRAFILAGAKTLIMSLWKVPDQQTQELMEEFYQRMLTGQPRADALRAAQLLLKAKYIHPYYWGAFICQGTPNALSQ